MEGERCGTAIWMSVLAMGAPLPSQRKAEAFKDGLNLAWLQGWGLRHSCLDDGHGVRADELSFELRLSIFEEKGDNLLQVGVQLVEGSALRMCSWPPGDIPHVQASGWIAFDDRGVIAHGP